MRDRAAETRGRVVGAARVRPRCGLATARPRRTSPACVDWPRAARCIRFGRAANGALGSAVPRVHAGGRSRPGALRAPRSTAPVLGRGPWSRVRDPFVGTLQACRRLARGDAARDRRDADVGPQLWRCRARDAPHLRSGRSRHRACGRGGDAPSHRSPEGQATRPPVTAASRWTTSSRWRPPSFRSPSMGTTISWCSAAYAGAASSSLIQRSGAAQPRSPSSSAPGSSRWRS